MNTTNRVLLVANLLVGAFLLGSATTQSVSATETNAVISACVAKSNGALRISSKCAKTERPITWKKTVESPVVKTKLITLNYHGNQFMPFYKDGNPCGDGVDQGYSDASGNKFCSITLRVVTD